MLPCFPTESTERQWQMLTGPTAMNKTFEACDFVLLQTNLSLECPMYGKFSVLSDCLKTILLDVLPLSIIGLPERTTPARWAALNQIFFAMFHNFHVW